MRSPVLIAVVAVVSGCAAFDPAPFVPDGAKLAIAKGLPSIDQPAPRLEKASERLGELAELYVGKRNEAMRGQLAFDVPMIGLAVAAVASGVYGGAQGLTTGFGLGSATLGGSRTYFGPQVRAAAYGSAASSFRCGSVYALNLAGLASARYQEAKDVRSNLDERLDRAQAALLTQEWAEAGGVRRLTGAEIASLLAARDAAMPARGALNGALSAIDLAPLGLQSFALLVIKGTDERIISGTQDLKSTISAIQDSQSAGSETNSGTAPSNSAKGPLVVTSSMVQARSLEETVAELYALTGKANAIAKEVENLSVSLQSCALPTA